MRLLKSTFAVNVSTKPTTLKSVTTSHTKQPAEMLHSNASQTNTRKTVTTDNTHPIVQNGAAAETLKNFTHTLGKKIMTKTSWNAQANKKGKKLDQSSGTLSMMIPPAQSLMVHGALTLPVVLDKAASSPQTHSLIAQVAKEKLVNQENGKELLHEVLSSDSKTTTASKKLIVTEEASISESPKTLETNRTAITSTPPSNRQNQQSSKQSILKTLLSNNKTTADSEQSVITNKPSAPDNSKTQLSNTPFAAPLDQSSLPKQKVLTAQESSIPTAEKTTPSNNDTDQKDLRSKIQVFELPEKNRVQVGNLLVKSIAKKINPQRTQVFAPQAENGKELLHEVLSSDSKTTTASKKLIVTEEASISESPKTLETNRTAITSKAITDQKSGKEIASQMHAGDSKITIAGEKPLMRNEPAVLSDAETTVSTKPVITSTPPSNQQNQQSSKQSILKTLLSDNKTTADSEQSVITNKPSAPGNSKTQLSNTPFAAPQDQSSLPKQKVLTAQESSIPIAEKTTPSNNDTDQKDLRSKIQVFELPERNRVQVGNLLVKSIAKKINPQRTQVFAPQVENHNKLLTNQASKPNIELGEQVLVSGNVQLGITEQSPTLPASVAFAKTAGNADSGDSVGEQIQESIHSSFRSGSQHIVIRLNPPELGKVVIKFTEQGDDITGLLQVDKPQTRYQIQQVLPEIIQNLQDSGIAIKRLEVVLTNQQEQYTSKDQSSTAGQDNFSEQQGSPNPESKRNNTTYNQWLTNIDNVTEFIQSQVQLTDNSINMLV